MDGTHRVTEGYYVAVDLREAQVVIPDRLSPATCQSNGESPSPLRTVVPDPNAPTVPNWVDSPVYRSRLAINGSFFKIGDVHAQVCTEVYGYVVSNRQLVNPEEKITFSRNGRHFEADAGTLVFYTGSHDVGWHRRADVKWYPMFPGHPF